MEGKETLSVSQSLSLRLLMRGGVGNPECESECESEATDACRGRKP